MQLPILIEPKEGGGFRARAGEPFNLSADGQTESSAAEQLTVLLRERLQTGARLGVISLRDVSQTPLHFEPLPDDDWFFKSMDEAIAENRRKEDESYQ